MIEPANFAALVDKAMILSGRGHMRPVIEKELLHSGTAINHGWVNNKI